MEFIETLYVKNGNILNLEYHLKRIKNTLKYFKFKTLKLPKLKEGEYRVRITYNQFGIKNIEYFPIKRREFKKFKLIKIDFDYKFKYKNRNHFLDIYSKYKNFDEFILIKNNLITDTTISNIAFFTGKEWITPKYPLLKGTKREELLNKKILKVENIHISDIKYFKKIALINAIVGFREIENFVIIK